MEAPMLFLAASAALDHDLIMGTSKTPSASPTRCDDHVVGQPRGIYCTGIRPRRRAAGAPPHYREVLREYRLCQDSSGAALDGKTWSRGCSGRY
eukprot:4116711-Pyramimonas_sp.AAC.1